jgi:hypothetical protein
VPTIRDQYLGLLDNYRGMLGAVWDLRRYDVVLRTTTWAGGVLPGDHGATPTVVETALTCNGQRVKVEQVSQRDIIASGGQYQDQDLRIGPLTPYSAGFTAGFDPSVLDPAPGTNMSVVLLITGPAYPAGALFRKLSLEMQSGNFRYCMIVRKTGADA